LISSDLDGTLLDDGGNISGADVAAIGRWLEAGNHFALNSGRAPDSILLYERLCGLIRPNGFGVGFNGSVVYRVDSREWVYHAKMAVDTAKYIIAELKRFCADIAVYDGGGRIVIESMTDYIRRYQEHVHLEIREIGDFGVLSEDISKILVIGEPIDLSAMQRYIDPLIVGRAQSVSSAKYLLEFNQLGADKGVGLRKMAEMLGIDISHTIAVGDNHNDLQMLEAAGLGIATANAVDEAKAAADAVWPLTNNQSAISGIIDSYI
jgi:hypothetical protein